jgi:hypothetical protein
MTAEFGESNHRVELDGFEGKLMKRNNMAIEFQSKTLFIAKQYSRISIKEMAEKEKYEKKRIVQRTNGISRHRINNA